jgi:hypothetical protein
VCILIPIYEKHIKAVFGAATGIVIVKTPSVADTSSPKLRTKTALFDCELL